VDGPHGEKGWLFGTIHALPDRVDWRSPIVERALEQSDELVLEIAAVDDDAATRRVLTKLSRTPGQPLLSSRVPPEERPALLRILNENNVDEAAFGDIETWAAALMLAQLSQESSDADNGIDRALVRSQPGKPVAEFEGAERQLRIFDSLPEKEQRDMLALVVSDSKDSGRELKTLSEAWRKGDVEAIARETNTGLLSDPELRDALYVQRNRAWMDRLESILKGGRHPFVAVGAAHLAGPDGLPAMLVAKGWKVTRIQ
jgi:uncharacterized protein YbaP (TraB family)